MSSLILKRFVLMLVAASALLPLHSLQAQFTIDQDASAAEDEIVDADPDSAAVEEIEEEEWDRPKILVIRAPRTPDRLMRGVLELVSPVGEIVDWREFEREARRSGLSATADASLETMLRDRDITLIIIVGRRVVNRRPVIALSYREGRFGTPMLSEEHPIFGDSIPDRVAERIQAETILAVTALTRPAMRDTPDATTNDSAPVQAGAVVQFGVSAGLGVGSRGFEGPLEAGSVRLETSVFPSATMQIRTLFEPVARGRFSMQAELEYQTSVGLRTTDTRIDGSTRETSSRAQRLDLGLALSLRLGDSPTAVTLGLWAGYATRIFDTEAPVSLPDYSLGSVATGLRVTIPLGSERIVLMASPTLEFVFPVGDGLNAAAPEPGIAYGGMARLQIGLTSAWALEAIYRESHATLPASVGSVRDVERFATLGVVYAP